MAERFASDVRALYANRAFHLLPFIGDCYVTPSPTDLRMVVVGINSYISPQHWPPGPDWFAGWFSRPKFPFSRRARRALCAIAAGLAHSRTFDQLAYRDPASAYATNAVKVYMPEAVGKKADQLSDAHFDENLPQWLAQLDLMAQHDVLPHGNRCL